MRVNNIFLKVQIMHESEIYLQWKQRGGGFSIVI